MGQNVSGKKIIALACRVVLGENVYKLFQKLKEIWNVWDLNRETMMEEKQKAGIRSKEWRGRRLSDRPENLIMNHLVVVHC